MDLKIIVFVLFWVTWIKVDADFRNFPVSKLGTSKTTNLTSLDCHEINSPMTQIVKEYVTFFPGQENLIRSGILCSHIEEKTNCSGGFSSYTFHQSKDKIKTNKDSCLEAISIFKEGRMGTVHYASPSCYYLRDTFRNQKYIQLSYVILPFDPYKNGITSNLFGGVCQSYHCASLDDLTHWFLDKESDPGCKNLKEGFLDIFYTEYNNKKTQMVKTSYGSYSPITTYCKGVSYCGYTFIRDKNFVGVTVKDRSDMTWEKLINQLPSCKDNSLKTLDTHELDNQLVNVKTESYYHYQECMRVSSMIQTLHSVSSSQLGAFIPFSEGTYPGYKIENSKLIKYTLTYRYVESMIQEETGHGINNKLITVTGDTINLWSSDCTQRTLFKDEHNGNCDWYNGVIITDGEILIPQRENNYLPNYQSDVYSEPIILKHNHEDVRVTVSHNMIKPVITNSTEGFTNILEDKWMIILTLTIAFIMLSATVCICIKKRQRNSHFRVSEPSVHYTVKSGKSNRSTISRQSGSTSSRRVRVIQGVPSSNYLEWAGQNSKLAIREI